MLPDSLFVILIFPDENLKIDWFTKCIVFIRTI